VIIDGVDARSIHTDLSDLQKQVLSLLNIPEKRFWIVSE
jgi:hypothetical protein